jgi:DNA modification methylase
VPPVGWHFHIRPLHTLLLNMKSNKQRFNKSKLSWSTVKRRLGDLVPHSLNPRVASEEFKKMLMGMLKKFGLVEIPAVDIDGTILAGHQRIAALIALYGPDYMIEVRAPSRRLTEKERKSYLLASNRLHADWDWTALSTNFDIQELLSTGFDSIDLSNIFDDNLDVEDDCFDEEAEMEEAQKTDIKPGDLFALGRHRLLCADALDPNTAMTLMAGKRADVINDDLPYNINLSYEKGVGGKGHYGGHKTNDNKTDEEYRIFVKTVMQNALSVTKPDAHVFFFCDERYVWLFQSLYKELGLDSKRLCIWLKDNASPTPALAFNKVTEYAVYGTRGKPYLNDKIKNLNEVMNKEVASGNRLSDDIMDLLNIWLVKRLPGNEMEHPTQKSPTLHEKVLRRCSRPGDIVLDLTAGSGSLLSACEQLKRTAYVCDHEPVFCQLIINRFKKISNEKVIKLN